MVKGKTRGDINVRSTPSIPVGNANIAFVSRGIVEFLGIVITSAIDGKKYIELTELDGMPISGAYIASWVVEYADYVPPVVGVPVLVHTIEVYSDGSLKIDGTPYP